MDNLPMTPKSPCKELKAKDCPRFEFCSASICPLDEQSIRLSNWLPDDEICSSQEFSKVPWILNQRKLQKKVRNRDFCFTHEMLCRNCVITVATEGIDPDHDYTDLDKDIAKWLDEHPEKQPISDAKREELKKRMVHARQGISPHKKGAIRIEKQDKNE